MLSVQGGKEWESAVLKSQNLESENLRPAKINEL